MRSASAILFWVHSCIFFFFFTFSSLSLRHPNNLTFYGDAHFRNSTICLTQEPSCPSSSPSSSSSHHAPPPSSPSGIGRALYVYPIRFLDSTTDTAVSFSCRFSFFIIPSPICPCGDGIAFLITSNADSFSFSNGLLGLPDSSLSPLDSFVAVEFDTNFDPALGDINDNHIGINVNSIVSVASVDVLAKGIDLKSGRKITTWIEYNNELKLIRVWVGYLPIKPPSPLLSSQIDLSLQFKQYMHVGFSASNGQGSAIHLVERWRFKTFESRKQPSIAPEDTVEEGDCLVCSPDDSHDGSNHDFGVERKPKLGDLALFVVGLAASVLALSFIVAVISFFLIKKKRQAGGRGSKLEGQTYRAQMNRVPTRLSLADIKSATVGFHHDRIVGSGASATVYKGCLPSGGTVAVKRFDRANWQECKRNPFSTEFATMVGCLRHKNLVQLQGWCCEEAELALVYEYLPNGSLDKILHQISSCSIFLSWQQRLNILVGVASALSYLHEECERQIIHRDVKSCNIMLDAGFNAKLGDFGLAEVYEHRSVAREATIPAGTMGYLAPEYVYSGVPSVKTDVYSFGVVVLEVATGRRPVDDDGIILVDWVWDVWERGKLVEAADPALRGKFEGAEMERTIMVGLCCVHPDHEKRPTVKDAARILKGEAPVPLLPARKPAVRIRSVVPANSEEDILNSADHSPEVDDAPWLTPRSQFS